MQRKLPGSTKGRFFFGAILLVILLIGLLSDWIMEWLWLGSLGYEQVFWTIKITQFLLFGSALIVALLYVLPNMHILGKLFRSFQTGPSPLDQFINNISTKHLRAFFYGFGVFISFLFSFAFFVKWDTYFRFHWNEVFNQVDPIFGNDIGFYLFRLPFIELIQDSLTALAFFITAGSLVLYLYSGALSVRGSKIEGGRKIVKHISMNAGFWLLLLSWGYFLDRYKLMYDSSGVVFGAGYVEMNIDLPVLWILTVLCAILGLLAFYAAFRNRFKLLIGGGIVTVLIGILGQTLLPPLIRNFMVEPNELELETPYMEHNIALTRDAYDLDAIDEQSYEAGDTLTWNKIQQNQSTLDNIRLWDPRLLIQTYRQLQEIRLYYQFYQVDVDRYHTNEGYQQMMVSARELSDRLPAKADTWVNRHLQYTHGFGLVMSPVAQEGRQGDPRLVIKDLPPVSEVGLEVSQPAIYYGEHNPDYKIVNTDIKELDYPRGDQNVYTSYEGEGGVSIDNFFEKLLFAWQFSDINILLTDYIREGSKIQFWKRITERVRRIAPFLEFEDDPYVVLSEGKLYWIQDAYTASPHFPYSEPFQSRYNYLRNSVKVVVDAYHGTVEFYAIDEDDPVLNVYRDIFPGMFRNLSEMPETIKQHLRYPEHLFNVQIDKYNTYHMTNPQVFYNNEDLWTPPKEMYGGNQIRMEPYYILSKVPGDDRLQYLLISPVTPNNRDNMIAWIAAKSDFPNYGEVVVYKLPKERLILGPAQIEAKIDQDTEISRQLSLWDQRGSSVIRGNLMVIPIEDSFLYVEPVFLIAEGVDIPQLQRVIVTAGEKIAMERTLDQSIEAIFGKRQPDFATIDTARSAISDTLRRPVTAFPELSRIKSLWEEAQQALRNGNWQDFGEKMNQINEILNNR